MSAIARNHEMIENSKYKKSFQHELDSLLIDIDKIESREWRPTDENHQVHMLACDLRLHVQYSSINASIKIYIDTSEELKEFLLQDEFDVIVRNDVPGFKSTSKTVCSKSLIFNKGINNHDIRIFTSSFKSNFFTR